MRVVLIALAAALAASQAPAQAPLQPATGPVAPAQPETRRPVIVDSLAPPAAAPVLPPVAAPAAPIGNGRPVELVRLEDTIKRHQESLEAISKQLEEGLHQKKRLVVAQKLLESIVHLKRAERLLGSLDARVEAAKANIKKFGEQADEIAESVKASEVAHRKELADLNAKLGELRTALGEQEKVLAALVVKRGRIATTVSKWKDHVATLHDAHEALAAPAGAPQPAPAAEDDSIPEPPPAGSLLRSLGTFGSGNFAPRRRVAAATGDFDFASTVGRQPGVAVGQLVKAPGVVGDLTDAAIAEVAARTFREVGQGRFADADADAEAEAEARSGDGDDE